MLRHTAEPDEALGEERVDDREEEVRIRSRPDEMMLARLRRGTRAARVDDHHAAAALADRAQPARHVGRRHQAAVRHERVGAKHEQVVGPVEVRHGRAEHGAEHEPDSDLLRHLVDGARREHVLRAERADEDRPVEAQREAVDARVAEVDRDGVAPALADDGAEPPLDLGEGLVPGGGLERAIPPDERSAQPIRVGVEFLQGVGLRTDEAAAEDVVVVAADADDLAATRADLESTGRLAERADAIAGSSMHAHGCSRDDRFVPGPDEDELCGTRRKQNPDSRPGCAPARR